ncbi:hypothetical protein [Halobaculum sp. P14]|uniref:hypothetical protein n=1 Tax=Halobaculum sp. P14 TaxID=3421638 RepID=UPI003EB6B929
MTAPAVYDHVRLTGGDHPHGTYRVVGVDEEAETAALLRVADGEGRRVHTGDVVAVDAAALADAEPAENPDENRPLGDVLASQVTMLYWSARLFGGELAAHPAAAAAAGVLLLVGLANERASVLPEAAASVVVLAGALALAYVGSGRLSR